MADQVDGVTGHLLREFARGAQDQRAGGGGLEIARAGRVLALGTLGRFFAASQGLGGFTLEVQARLGFGIGLLLQQRVQHGQQEGCGLAAAGLAGNHQVDVRCGFVVRRQGQRDGLFLHGGGLGEAQVFHGANQFGRQAHFRKPLGARRRGLRHGCRWNIESLHRREVALHFKSVGHFYSHTHSKEALVRAALSSMVKNINHQTTVRAWAAGGSSAL
jgi:hypothetical protein